MTFEKELPEWKEKGVKPPQSKLDEGWKVQDKPPAAWLNWQMNKTYEALKEVQEKAAEKTDVTKILKDAKDYTDQTVGGLGTHAGDVTMHITAAERNAWNAKETPEGAQAKANQAESNVKAYTDSRPWQKHQVTEGVNAKVVTDLNTDLPTGWYMGADMVGAPTNEWHYVEHIRHNELWCVQNAYCFNRNSYYTRAKRNGSWGAWSLDLFQSGVDAKNNIAGALNAKGVPASANDDFATLATKIGQIKTETPPIIQPIDFQRSNSRTVQEDWQVDTWQTTIATVNMKSFLAFSGGLHVENEPDLNADYNQAGVRILFKDQHGVEEQIISAAYSRTRRYESNDHPIIIGRSYKATEYIYNDPNSEWPKGKWLDFKSTFDINGPVSIVAEFSFRKPYKYSYSATLKASAIGTLVYY
ncbi:pyocin knob domain-containing protein [Paenibacillus sp. NAIST15-1]|uniref:pyocin knob domain-containing protein n=1 Tax=Paenibacillus sp. NAIST15-1 TaxID=1605994 RepID=UPI00086C8A2F|nr:pyocin knob domain-containing protein [Paenibacillus sp. NAIST15-1]GAV10514.1 hypothetical protein PBN151_0424 [Paenibacillus sp. NAIST15-1]